MWVVLFVFGFGLGLFGDDLLCGFDIVCLDFVVVVYLLLVFVLRFDLFCCLIFAVCLVYLVVV